jgi:serine/threonine protein kinase
MIGEGFNYNAILDDYQILEELGKGGFGTVMLGRHKEDKKEVAIKFMDVSENCKGSTNISILTNYSINGFYSGICEHNSRNIQGGRILEKTNPQEHYCLVPYLRGGKTTMHDHGIC